MIWAGIIFWFSARPTATTSEIYLADFVIKKTAHFGEYAIMVILLFRSLKHTLRWDKQSLLVLALAVTILYAISDEFHQSFVPGREPHLRDIMIDAVGAGVALWLVNKQKLISI